MRKPLHQLKPGTRFRQPELGITGTLLMVNACRARVRIDQPQRNVEFIGRNGQPRNFRATRYIETSWTPIVSVEVLSFQPLDEGNSTMAKKKASTTKKTTNTRKQPSTDGSMSQLDAAVKVLTESKEPMTTKQMIEAMASKGYWSSPGGKTPWATLYSAITREIKNKGKEARFAKVDKGQFQLKK
ncbi:winged helix-turn-helix domain-containing protein [Thalassoglobus sp.]|uniref:winged helix-turn-helix domain-containing protein n=1 Tax=Thalassoglobus sp. TaxID=2795869 RepID=UPI003AA8176F